MEERGLREGDWNDPLDSRESPETGNKKFESSGTVSKPSINTSHDKGDYMILYLMVTSVVMSEEERKKILNAPKRIKKVYNKSMLSPRILLIQIESLLEKLNSEMKIVDDQMILVILFINNIYGII